MTRERHERISELFTGALQHHPTRREEWLRAACCGDEGLFAEVQQLLAHDREEFGMLDAADRTRVDDPSTIEAPPGVPRIAGYRIRRLIGEGGMGSVYEAEQESPRRTVAIKVLRSHVSGPALLKRFEQEAHVLAQLQHEGIARIYDTGQMDSDSRAPYLVMEFLEGASLIHYVEANELELRARLELFTRICDAIQYAHQKGVIHRDIKPANILVTGDGQPKVLDFGVARVTDEDMRAVTLQTDAGQIVGTLAYMSPEQAAGDVDDLDTRSDVYALGVLLYEMLSGHLPCEVSRTSLAAAVDRIRNVDPPRLGTLDPHLRGDVEVIAHKALEKDRERRYPSASQLAADVRRYLDHEPITARPASAIYQLRKFARRNKALVVGGTIAALALVAGTIASVLFAISASGAREVARDEADRATQAAGLARLEAASSERLMRFVLGTLGKVDPSVSGLEEPTLRSAMDAMAAGLGDELADEPEIRARLHGFLGSIYGSLGAYTSAHHHLDRSIEIYRGIEVSNTYEMDTLITSAFLHYREQNLEVAHAQASEARAQIEAIGKTGHSLYGNALMMLAEIAKARNETALARQLIEATLGLRRHLHQGDHEDVAVTLLVRGDIHFQEEDMLAAEASYLESLEMRRRLYPGDHPLVAESLSNLSQVYFDREEYDLAAESMREAVDMRRNSLPPDHPAHASGYLNLGILEAYRAQHDVALEYLAEAARLYKSSYGPKHRPLAITHIRQGDVHKALSELDEARDFYKQALAILAEVAPGSPNHRATLERLVDIHGRRSETDEAQRYKRQLEALSRPRDK